MHESCDHVPEYFLRMGGVPPYLGPFTLDQLRQNVTSGELSLYCEVIEASGQDPEQLHASTEWILLAELLRVTLPVRREQVAPQVDKISTELTAGLKTTPAMQSNVPRERAPESVLPNETRKMPTISEFQRGGLKGIWLFFSLLASFLGIAIADYYKLPKEAGIYVLAFCLGLPLACILKISPYLLLLLIACQWFITYPRALKERLLHGGDPLLTFQGVCLILVMSLALTGLAYFVALAVVSTPGRQSVVHRARPGTRRQWWRMTVIGMIAVISAGVLLACVAVILALTSRDSGDGVGGPGGQRNLPSNIGEGVGAQSLHSMQRFTISSSLNATPDPRGSYDQRFLATVQSRWYELLANERYNLDRAGKVVLEFNETHDGRITDMSVKESNASESLTDVGRRAVIESAPYPTWPIEMRESVGSDVRKIEMTFQY